MFNIGPAELLIIGLVLLIAVGPEQLPSVIRRVGSTVAQARSMTDGLRSEFMAGLDEIERATDVERWSDADAAPAQRSTASNNGSSAQTKEPDGDDRAAPRPAVADRLFTDAPTGPGHGDDDVGDGETADGAVAPDGEPDGAEGAEPAADARPDDAEPGDAELASDAEPAADARPDDAEPAADAGEGTR